MNYEALFVDPTGRTSRGQFTGALLAFLAALTFYYFLVRGPSGQYGMLVMLFPALVLHARRLHDMGRTGWLLLVPGALMAATAWFHLFSPESPAKTAVTLTATAVFAAFALWGLVGKGEAGPNRFGEPARVSQ